MKNTSAPVRPTIANLKAGNLVQAGYIRRDSASIDANRFVGFKVGEHYFSCLRHMKEFFGEKNLSGIEAKAMELNLGSVTAEWYCTELDESTGRCKGYLWGAYLWEGSFRVGTSADRLVLRSV